MKATMYGWEIVWPSPIGSAASSYARARSSSGTNSSRGTRAMASSTRSSRMSRARSCSSTIQRRWSSVSGDAGTCDSELREQRVLDVDRARRRCDADPEHRHLRVPGDQRSVTAAPGVMRACEVGELPALRSGDEHLAGVGIAQRRRDALTAAGELVEQSRILVAVPARNDPRVLEEKRRVDRLDAVELRGGRPRVV